MLRRPSEGLYRMIFLCALLMLVSGYAGAQHPDAVTAAKAEVEQGKAAMKKSDYVAAAAFFRKAIELSPDNKEAHDSYFRATQQAALAEINGEKTNEAIRAKLEPAKQKLISQYLEWARQHPKAEKLSYKLAFLEKLKATYPPEKSSWSASGMSDLFSAYRLTNADKAMALAEEMVKLKPQDKIWLAYLDYQKAVTQARSSLDHGKFAEAASLLSKVTLPRYLEVSDYYLLKAEAADHAGETQRAYDELAQRTAIAPTDALREGLKKYGAKLKKTPAQIEDDLWKLVDAQAKPVKDFSLARYGDEKNVSLSDYRGRVVLINFWFPSCGPCRAENPSLQRMLTKFGPEKFVILAINTVSDENQLVMPYLKGNKFDFTPLRGSEEFAEKEFSVDRYPTNLLVDQQGRIVAKPGNLGGKDKLRTFEMQVQLLLSRGAQKPIGAK